MIWANRPSEPTSRLPPLRAHLLAARVPFGDIVEESLPRRFAGAAFGDQQRRARKEVERGLARALPGLRKTVLGKLALAVGAMIEGQTLNTVELAKLLPLKTERQDRREQWLRRLLKNPLLK